ncbi:MAG: glycosyltransferase [Anaerolineaceae bacterium]|nr:glycosyltransferase [Anaerolineaceae bacterium]
MLRLPTTVACVDAFIKSQTYLSEIIIVENASTDTTYELAMEMRKTIRNLQVLREPVKGKGQAVKRGMLAARGEYRLICDADLAMPVTQIHKFIPPALTDFDVAIASREAKGAQRYNEPLYRHLIGRVFNYLVRILVLPGLQDTQCGFKCFRAGVVEQIFKRQSMSGWAFDVELLAIAQELGYSIREIPIEWYYGPHSRVRLIVDAPKMFNDLIKIRVNLRRGVYQLNT